MRIYVVAIFATTHTLIIKLENVKKTTFFALLSAHLRCILSLTRFYSNFAALSLIHTKNGIKMS